MNQAKLLNPFFTSIFDVLEETSGEKAQRGKLLLQKEAQFASLGFQVILTLDGQIKGHVILDMSKEVAIKFAEIMNMEEIGEFNEMVKSSIKEIGDSLAQKAIQKLAETQLKFDVKPTELLESPLVKISEIESLSVISAPLELPFGQIVINLALCEAK